MLVFVFEESRKVAWAARRRVDQHGEAWIETTSMPPETFPRSLAAPSMLAHFPAPRSSARASAPRRLLRRQLHARAANSWHGVLRA